MKKWLVILSIIFTVGFISSAVLAGRVFYEDLKVYTDYDKKDLEVSGLQNIYIKSSIPIEIHPTAEKPYVEFNQSFTDIIGAAPKYELSTEVKGDSTYIDLNQTKEALLWLGVKESKAKLSVYLPQSTINRLYIEDQTYYYYNSRNGKQVINLEGINVNELDVNMDYGEFILSGSYEKVNISARGKLNLESTSPARVNINQSMNQYLSGKFEKISITGNNGTDIVIDSETECQVEISANSSTVGLKGKYSRLKVNGNSNSIDLRSESICKLITQGAYNNMTANGPFNEISIDNLQSEFEIQTTVVPDKVSLGTDVEDNAISLTLPSNIPGFEIKYINDYELEDGELDYYKEYGIDSRSLQSDFTLTVGKTDKNELTYTYGNGGFIMVLNKDNNNTLELIDGGYSSSISQ